MQLSRGSRIGRYEILDRLGAGGMGVVYSARDDVLDRVVAVKLLPPEFASDPERVQRFEREARATGRLNHPHIVAIFDAIFDGEQPYLVTELLEGETLRSRLSRAAMPTDAVLALARQVAGALDAAHAQGIVHRDLKPDNILITRTGSAKVLDFGLAKVVAPAVAESQTRLSDTAPGVALGTIGYMAPEQVDGRPVDHRADIFSLGVVLHEALTGHQPFRRDSAVDTLHAILHDEAPALPPGVPRALQQIVRRCLQKHPDARFQSARDLEFALTSVENHLDTPEHQDKPTRDTRPVAALLVTFAILLIALGGWALYRRGTTGAADGASMIRSIAVLPLEDLSREHDQEYLADSLTEALITDLSQIRALRVIARASVMRYKGAKRPLPDIARELGVSGIVEGTVLRVNDQLRVTAHLVQASTEQQIWGEKYDRDFRDILALQSELASTIADRIALQLTPDERAKLTPAAAPSVLPASHELYLRGRYFWNKRDPESLQRALDAFTGATKADPRSAAAWAGLADTYFYLGYAFGHLPPKEAMPKALDAAQRALAIDANLAGAHNAVGLVQLFFNWDRAAGENSLRRALQLDPTYVLAHRSMAALLLTGRQPQAAIEQSQEAVRLDPVSLAENYFLALCYFNAGNLDATERACRRTLELEPTFGSCANLIGDVYERRGNTDKAVAAYLGLSSLDAAATGPASTRLAAYRAGGMPAFREVELQEMVKGWDGWHFMAYVIATKQARAGHREAAYEWLRRAKDAKSAGIILANSDYAFEPYRADPTFRELLGTAFTSGN
jgi:serine/threonine protein kinase/tetratricopeptide (TPR) repeat protein